MVQTRNFGIGGVRFKEGIGVSDSNSISADNEVSINATQAEVNGLLSVINDQMGYAATFQNDGNNASRVGIKIQCGADSPVMASQVVYAAFFDGDGTASGGIRNSSTATPPEFYGSSDARIKQDIAPTRIAGLETINNIELCEFRFKNDPNQKLHKIGFIAQNCEQTYPEMVAESWDPDWDFSVKAVGPQSLIPVLVKSIQELSQKVNELERQLRDR